MNLKMTINEIVKSISKRITKREVNLIASKYEISTDEKSKSQVVSEIIKKVEDLNEQLKNVSEVVSMYQFFLFVQKATAKKYYGSSKNSVVIAKDLEAEFFETVEVKRSELPSEYNGHNKDLTQYKRFIQLKKYGLIVMFKDDLSCNPLVLGKWGFWCYAGDSEMRKGTYSNRERTLSSKESKAITKAWDKMKRIKA